MARVAAYLRRSTMGDEDMNYSIQNQAEDVQAWAAANGHTVVETYSDPGGKSYTLNRPIFQQMLADAREGQFDIVAVGRYDRFSRVQMQQTVARYQLDESGVQVVSATQPVPDGAIGEMLRSGYAFAAEMELDNIRARTSAGKRARVFSGKLHPVARAKYGYQFADEKKERYIPHPETADVVRRIFSMAAQGIPTRRICLTLNQEQVPAPSQVAAKDGNGGKYPVAAYGWQSKTLTKILKDTAYCGHMVGMQQAVETRKVKDKLTGEIHSRRHVVNRNPDDARTFAYGEDVCPALVSVETFQSVQDRLKRNKAESSRNMKHPHMAAMRSGIARCGYCGRNLLTRYSNRHTQYMYSCGARTQRPDSCSAPKQFAMEVKNLDSAAADWFIRQLMHPEKMREMYDRWYKDVTAVWEAKDSQVRATRAALQEAQEQESSYLAAVGSAKTPAMIDRFVGLAEDAAAKVAALMRDLEGLEKQAENEQQMRGVFQTFEEFTADFAQDYENGMFISNEQLRRGLIQYDVKAYLYASDHEPRYRFTWLGGIDPEGDVSAGYHVK